jgi:hypothetical protein
MNLVVPAHADKRIVRDRNDVRGRLDIKLAVAGHVSASEGRARLIRHRLTTFRPWAKGVLEDGSSYVELLIDADDDPATDVQVTIDVRRGELSARIWDLDRNESLGKGRVWRDDRRSVTAAFPKRIVGGGTYRWYADTSYHREDSRHCGTASDAVGICSDRIPNRGLVGHRTR